MDFTLAKDTVVCGLNIGTKQTLRWPPWVVSPVFPKSVNAKQMWAFINIVTCRPREGGEKRAAVFNARCMAPAAASEEMFVNDTTEASTVGKLSHIFNCTNSKVVEWVVPELNNFAFQVD